jgi:two-component system, response regulator
VDKPTILLVEDNPDEVLLTQRALRKSPVEVDLVVARDGVEAIDYLLATGSYAYRDAALLPTIVLLDLKLPKLNGLEVLRQVRKAEQTHALPVIILTSSREEQDIAACYACGANSYVRKPVDFTEFTEMVRLLSTYWLQCNEQLPRRGGQS